MNIRIIAGEKKGQKLCSFSTNLPIRPMTQRVKKSVFDTLFPYFENDNPTVLDLFSGCGNLSFESLSRGAQFSHAVEKNKQCIEVIKKNARKLDIIKEMTIYQKDVFSYLRQYKRPYAYDIIFIDPPFNQFLSQSLINCLKTSFVCDNKTIIVLEISSREAFLEDKDILLKSKKNYGDKNAYFFKIKKTIKLKTINEE